MSRPQIRLLRQVLLMLDEMGFCFAVDFLTEQIQKGEINEWDCRVVLGELVRLANE